MAKWQACTELMPTGCHSLVNWQLTAPRCLQTLKQRDSDRPSALDNKTHFRIALLVHGLNPTSDTNVAGGRAAGERHVLVWSRQIGPQLAVAQALTSCQRLSDPLASRRKHSRSGSDIGDHWWLDPMAEIVVHPQRRARLCQALRSSLVCSTTCCCSQSLQIITPNTRLLAF